MIRILRVPILNLLDNILKGVCAMEGCLFNGKNSAIRSDYTAGGAFCAVLTEFVSIARVIPVKIEIIAGFSAGQRFPCGILGD